MIKKYIFYYKSDWTVHYDETWKRNIYDREKGVIAYEMWKRKPSSKFQCAYDCTNIIYEG